MNASNQEPWNVLSQLQRHLNHYFERDVEGDPVSSSATADWTPYVDVAEYADRFVLKLDIPGVEADAVDITLEQGVLTISGNRIKDSAEIGRASCRERV